MKKILFVAASAILLAAGCQKTEVLNQAVGDPMTFSTGMAKLTKSPTATGEQNLATQNFQVWSYTAYTDDLNSVIPGSVYENINGIIVNYDIAADGTGSCSTTEDYYWPGTGLKLDFFAISSKSTFTSASSPATVDETEGGTGDDTDQGSTGENTETPTNLSVSFENPGLTLGQRKMTLNGYSVTAATMNSGAAIGADDDLMVAEFVRQDQAMGDPKKSVSLHFKHALSKVRFKFITTKDENTKETVTVKSLKVEGLKNKGNLVVSETSSTPDNTNGRTPVSLAWNSVTGDVDYERVFTNFTLDTDQAWNTSFATLKEDAYHATWLVMPQTIDNVNVEISYSITNSETNKTVEDTRLFPLTRKASGEGEAAVSAFNEWGINKITTYTINISPNKISFNPSVEDWDTAGETNIGQEN